MGNNASCPKNPNYKKWLEDCQPICGEIIDPKGKSAKSVPTVNENFSGLKRENVTSDNKLQQFLADIKYDDVLGKTISYQWSLDSIFEGGSPQAEELLKFFSEVLERIKEEITSLHDEYFNLLESDDRDDNMHKQYNKESYDIKKVLHKKSFPDCIWTNVIDSYDSMKRYVTSIQATYHKLKLQYDKLASGNTQMESQELMGDKSVDVNNSSILKTAGPVENENITSSIKLQGIPSELGELFKFIAELCERMKDVFTSLYAEYLNLKPENKKPLHKKSKKKSDYSYQPYRGISYVLDDKLHKQYHEMPCDISKDLHEEDFEDCLWFKAVKSCDEIKNELTYSRTEYYRLKMLIKKLATEKVETQKQSEKIAQDKVEMNQVA